MQIHEQNHSRALNEVMGYTYPKLYTGKRWYVGFYAFDPATARMRRKTIKVNFIEKAILRRQYASEMCKRIISQLDKGWNPWIEVENSSAYRTFDEVIGKYRRYLDKMFADGNHREETYRGYISYIKIMCNWNRSRKVPITYIYQFDRQFCVDLLEYVYIERENCCQTRDNYLAALRVFSSWLVQTAILKEKPTDGIRTFGKRSHKKQRTTIPDGEMLRLYDYLSDNNKHYLLACYLLHYCFIRPKEMSKLRISNFSIKNKTVYIPGEISKNRTEGTVTLPDKVTKLMLDLKVFDYPSGYYLFSKNFMPGTEYRSEKLFRDFWLRYVSKKLGFPQQYKFYSLKDTGITSMMRKYDRITVRDQARHSSILMTDIYTPHDIQEANKLIVEHEGIF